MSTKLKIAAAVAAAVLLSACSSPKHEPMPLVNFTPSMEVTEVWSKGLSSAEGFLVPAVYDDMVFAAGGKTLTRLNAKPNGPFLLTAPLPAVSALTATSQLSVFGTVIWKSWMPKERSAGKRN
jgi:hypothetical protein